MIKLKYENGFYFTLEMPDVKYFEKNGKWYYKIHSKIEKVPIHYYPDLIKDIRTIKLEKLLS